MGIFQTIRNKVSDAVGESRGAAGDQEYGNLRDPKPYESYYSNGMFKGYDGRLWLYFRFPEDVQVEWTKTYRESADNQSFLTNIFNSLGRSIYSSSESTRKDERIDFHIAMVRELTDEIAKYDDITPAHADFLDRMGGFSHPVWHSYFGVEMKIGSISSDVYGMTDKVRNYIDFMLSRSDIEFALYKESIETVTSVCLDNGMTPLDFTSCPEDFERLTAWYGESDFTYGMRREMTSASLQVPEHGKSIITGAGEIAFSAIKPRESRDMFMKDPFDSADVRFGKAILRPSVNAIHVNVRGEIRSPDVAAALFDDKVTRSDYKMEYGSDTESTSVGERKKIAEASEQAEIAAAEAARMQYAWLDNVEITTATIVDGHPSVLNEALMPYGLEAVNITERQHLALCSTVPCYPNPIFKVPAGNVKRNPNVNNFYAGVLSLSGLFRSTKPAGPRGILLGLSESGFEYKEIFTETDAAYKYSKSPTILVTGATGSGKTIQMLSMIAQTVYMGQQGIFLNPKPNASLKPFFDLLDGITINMSVAYLEENPGLLDPMFFLSEREDVGRLLADMIIRAQGMNAESNARTDMIRSMEELTTELVERAKMPLNQCSYDIIFGNRRADPPTPRISDDETVDFVRTKMISSPFWKATISRDPSARSSFQAAFAAGRPLLVEWDKSIVLPQEGTDPDRYTPTENDGVQSVVNLFRYASDVLGSGRKGGILAIDEAHILKTSENAMSLVKSAGRLWRQANINLMLATQNLKEFLDDDEFNIGAYVRLFIIMRVDEADPKEIDLFYKVSKLPRDDAHTNYIVNAGVKKAANIKHKKSTPSAYVIDNSYEWQGGVICGPWPERELAAALTDKEGEEARARAAAEGMSDAVYDFTSDRLDFEDIRAEDESAREI